MAKDGDIIDVMFGWIINLFSWILGLIVKLVIAIIGGIFNLLMSIFNKKDTTEKPPIKNSIAEENVR